MPYYLPKSYGRTGLTKNKAVEAINLLFNPTLLIDENENGLADGWEGTWLQTETTATFSIDGGQKIEITASPSGGMALSYLNTDYVIPAVKGEKFKYSFYAKNSSGVTVRIQIDAQNNTYGWLDTMSDYVTYDNADWTLIEYEFTIPDDNNIKYIATKLTVVPDASESLGSAWFKDAVLIKL